MNETQIEEKLTLLETKLDAIYASAEKTRRYFLWTLIITILAIVLPLIGTIVLIPYYLSTLNVADLLI